MIVIEAEAPDDAPAREALLDRCFGRARRFKTSERLRRGRRPAPGLALVARDASGGLAGTVRLWPIAAGSAGAALLLGPLAVEPDQQGNGIGAALMRRALAEAAGSGHRAVILVGDASYYCRFGFQTVPPGLEMPGPVETDRFLGLELVPGALTGAAGRVVATGRRALERTVVRAAA